MIYTAFRMLLTYIWYTQLFVCYRRTYDIHSCSYVIDVYMIYTTVCLL